MNWQKIYELLDPTFIIVAKHDVWPGQIWTAKKKSIPAFLVNASLSSRSSRTGFGIKAFLKYVYRDFKCICAISEEDARRFSKHYPRCQVTVSGDTKYDQVVIRRDMAKRQNLFPEKWLKEKWIFVAGSIWPEDEEHLLPALQHFLEDKSTSRIILVPHQPAIKTVDRLSSQFKKWGVETFSHKQQLNRERVLIVDTVGYLAGLYYHAQLAYVGGSFHQGIHNVMEPAVFGIPVLYGPVHENSYEAVQLARGNGGIVVRNQSEIYQQVLKFHDDEKHRAQIGQLAEKYATRNTGATEQLIKRWNPYLDQTIK